MKPHERPAPVSAQSADTGAGRQGRPGAKRQKPHERPAIKIKIKNTNKKKIKLKYK